MNLSIQSSKTIDFSRLHACFSFKPYLFALVFALTSRNKGNFLFPADHLIQQPCGSTLRFPCRVSVDVHCGTDIRVSEKFLHIFRLCAAGQQIACVGVPLRYNYDKPEKPRISRVFGYLARFFILFQTEKSSREVVIS